jgi:hypothetical protein
MGRKERTTTVVALYFVMNWLFVICIHLFSIIKSKSEPVHCSFSLLCSWDNNLHSHEKSHWFLQIPFALLRVTIDEIQFNIIPSRSFHFAFREEVQVRVSMSNYITSSSVNYFAEVDSFQWFRSGSLIIIKNMRVTMPIMLRTGLWNTFESKIDILILIRE